ncbi:hypothetical protein JHK84_031301 [Glycine max]|nr:hypothetical protein JHK86_031172 [Glycine max]KAG5145758.1 hypothetical protein JHK84_031301 [Glycine max]
MTETKAAEDAKEMVLLEEEKCAKKMVCMWGYLPRASPKKSPILSLVPVNLSDPSLVGDSWKDVCGGEKGKLITWGSMDDEGQSYLILGKHGPDPQSHLAFCVCEDPTSSSLLVPHPHHRRTRPIITHIVASLPLIEHPIAEPTPPLSQTLSHIGQYIASNGGVVAYEELAPYLDIEST